MDTKILLKKGQVLGFCGSFSSYVMEMSLAQKKVRYKAEIRDGSSCFANLGGVSSLFKIDSFLELVKDGIPISVFLV
jgi:hypothetical protein